jgi:hypothetical protein
MVVGPELRYFLHCNQAVSNTVLDTIKILLYRGTPSRLLVSGMVCISFSTDFPERTSNKQFVSKTS